MMVQVPAVIMLILRPVIVHTGVVADVSTTVRPELAVAAEAIGVELNVLAPGFANVIVWLPPTTVSVKLCVPAGVTPLVAVMVKVDTPVAVAVPESTPADDSVTPAGRVPAVTENVEAGEPEAVTLKVPNVPAVKVAELALVIAGACERFNVSTGSAAREFMEPAQVTSP